MTCTVRLFADDAKADDETLGFDGCLDAGSASSFACSINLVTTKTPGG
jgi:hypothetical protein